MAADSYVYLKAAGIITAVVAFTGSYYSADLRLYRGRMMRPAGAIITFVLCLTLFLAHQYLQGTAKVPIPFPDGYLDPFLIMPLLLHLVVLERKLLSGNAAYRMPLIQIPGFIVMVAFMGEIVFPLLSSRHVADLWDVIAYILGGLAYALSR